jgi:dephospho-CoA kinase
MKGTPVIVGLLGGVAAGKSTVARLLAARGARVIDADRIAHEVLSSEEVRPEIVARFGREVLDGDGRPDRERIAGIAFADPVALSALESILHPAVRRRILEEVAAATDAPAVVLDAPLLLEKGLAAMADVLVFVAASDRTRRERAEERRRWSREELELRESRQAPLAGKRAAAHHVVVNDGSLAELEERVSALWAEILEMNADR